MASSGPTLEELSAQISSSVAAITAYLKNNGGKAPTFAADGLHEYPPAPEIMGPRLALIEAASDLVQLAMGPDQWIKTMQLTVSFRNANQFRPETNNPSILHLALP